MRIPIVMLAAFAIAACSNGDERQWRPSGSDGYRYSASASDSLIRSGMTADGYDAALKHSPDLSFDADARYVGQEIRAHDEGAKILEQEANHRLSRHF